MKQKAVRRIAFRSFALVILVGAVWPVQAQDAKTPYPSMAPLDQYLMERGAEITLARSAAPESISQDSEVMILGRHGYETAVKGKNGFVCLVERSWSAGIEDPEFWNSKVRGPICLNPPAVRSYLPRDIRTTGWVLAGRSNAQMHEDLKAAFDKKEFLVAEPGAMAYMMSRQGNLSDHVSHWRPHLMFFAPPMDPAVWGAGLPGAPVIAFKDALEQRTVVMVPVTQWSDGTAAPADEH